MKKLLVLGLVTFSLQSLACQTIVTTKPIPGSAVDRTCEDYFYVSGAELTDGFVQQQRLELNNLTNQYNQRVQSMNQLIMNDLPQRHSIEQLLMQRQQQISRIIYIQNVLAGPLYPIQRQQAMFEFQQLQMGLANGDSVLNQFIQNYHFMYEQFWRLHEEAQVLKRRISTAQLLLNAFIENQKQTQPTPQRLAELEAEKQKLEKGKVKLLALAKEAEIAAARAKELQNESGSLVDELSETLNMDF